MSVSKHVSSFLHSVGEVMKNNRKLVIVVVLSAIVAGGRAGYAWYAALPARHYEYWYVPDRQPVPPLFHEAELLTKSIERQDASWSAEMQQLQSLIEQQQPHEFDLFREIRTTDALRAYVEKLLGLGEAAVQSFLRTQATASKLKEVLKHAPAKFEEMAALARRYADETPRADMKEDYAMLADIWRAKAQAAAEHQHDVELNLNSDLLAYLRERNLLLERMLTMLNHGLDLNDLRGAAQFTKSLQEVIRGHEFLSGALRTWRARMLHESPPTPKPAGEAKEQPKAASSEPRSGNEESSPYTVPLTAFAGGMLTAFAAFIGVLAKLNS